MTEIVIGSQLLISGFTYILIQGSNNETVGWRYSFINLEQSELLCVHERARWSLSAMREGASIVLSSVRVVAVLLTWQGRASRRSPAGNGQIVYREGTGGAG
jgi:hypothetical protein